MNASTEQFHQLFGNGKPQACTFAGSFRFASLIKTFKNKRQTIFGDANPGIHHGKLHPVFPFNCFGGGGAANKALFGKFEGIVDQIEQNLVQESGIGTQILRDLGRNLALKFNGTLRQSEFKGFTHGLRHAKEIKVLQMGLHFPLFNLGNIQHVADQGLQQLCRVL